MLFVVLSWYYSFLAKELSAQQYLLDILLLSKTFSDSFLSTCDVASSVAFSSIRFCSKWSIYNCLEVQTIETIYFITEISNIDSYLKILSFTILIASIVSFFSKEPWVVSWAFPTAVCLLRNRFQEHCSHGRDKINLNKQTRKGYFILSSFDVQYFSR